MQRLFIILLLLYHTTIPLIACNKANINVWPRYPGQPHGPGEGDDGEEEQLLHRSHQVHETPGTLSRHHPVAGLQVLICGHHWLRHLAAIETCTGCCLWARREFAGYYHHTW